MTSPLHLIAHIDAQPGQAEAVEAALRELVAASRSEPGCLQYDLHRDRADALRFVMLETWRNDAALAAHQATAHYRHFGDAHGSRLKGVTLTLLEHLA
ncbi:putative quinol monooxygenase [Metapseudomonas otitidis]|uniref:putative quinol monooxygenase n=1 Tax=Metapseudomonas otitidis TaxID=319939 RepID=UPI001AAE1FFB|nr:putative quinol monooxygenase [Pseudomonas otitidis]MBO2928439.1 antibiotic biosynthesis monooxygenase [Pseudomonas otitidis]